MEFIILTLACLTIALLCYENYSHNMYIRLRKELNKSLNTIQIQKNEIQNLKNKYEYRPSSYPNDVEKKKAQLEYAFEQQSFYDSD